MLLHLCTLHSWPSTSQWGPIWRQGPHQPMGCKHHTWPGHWAFHFFQLLDHIQKVGKTRYPEFSISGHGENLVVDDLPHKGGFMGMMTNRSSSPFVAPRHFIHSGGCRPSIEPHEVHDDVEVVSRISQRGHHFLNNAASSQVLSGREEVFICSL